MSESRTYTLQEMDRFKSNLARIRLERHIRERFDRCCHTGRKIDSPDLAWLKRWIRNKA